MNERSGGPQQRRNKPAPPRAGRTRFPDRGGDGWKGPIVDYKEVELLRKFLTASSKVMSRKRAGTNAREQRALAQAIKRARFLALLPYTGT